MPFRFKEDDPIDFGSLPFPGLPRVPTLGLQGFEGRQRYHLEIWAEKTTMHEILRPLCEQYSIWLMAASGHLSHTQVYDAAKRMIEDGRPARILYLSDLDPAGDSMPVAAARKLEWFQHFSTSPLRDALADFDLHLDKVVITRQQGDDYELPRTPLKESVDKNGDWRNLHGEGGLELDALEALHPGALEEIMSQAITRYFDTDLLYRVLSARLGVASVMRQRTAAALEPLQDAIDAVQEEYAALEKEIRPRLDALAERMRETWGMAVDKLNKEAAAFDLNDWPVPEADEAYEDSDSQLYVSSRDYHEQLRAYKAFQGREE